MTDLFQLASSATNNISSNAAQSVAFEENMFQRWNQSDCARQRVQVVVGQIKAYERLQFVDIITNLSVFFCNLKTYSNNRQLQKNTLPNLIVMSLEHLQARQCR